MFGWILWGAIGCTPASTTTPTVATTSTADTGHGCGFEGLTGWREETPLPAARESLAMVTSDDVLTVLGGWDPSRGGAHDTVWQAGIQDGALTGWTDRPSLPVPLEHHGAAVVDGTAWITGGDDGAAGRTEVYTVDLRQGTVADAGVLPGPILFHGATAIDDTLWVIGGAAGFGPLTAETWTRTVDPGASWTAGPALPEAVWATAIVVHDGVPWVVGGGTATGATDAIWRLDGDTWVEAGRLPKPRSAHGAFVHDGHLVVVGGQIDGEEPTRSVVAAPLTDLGTWSKEEKLPTHRFAHGIAVATDRVWVAGGWEGFDVGGHDTVLSAPLCEG